MQAAEAASIQSVHFELGSIEMEFQVVVKREGAGEAKLGFHIFAADATIGASGKIADERTQKVKIVLNPVLVGIEGHRSKLDISRDDDPADATIHEDRGKQTLNRP